MNNVETSSNPAKPQGMELKPNWVRCKICGYVTQAGHLRDLCPACGVKATLFEPFTENFSARRRRILSWHLHPVVVHMPQALSFLLAVLVIGVLSLTGSTQRIFVDTILVVISILPIAVLGSFLTGILDGRTRFRKLSTPFLRIKLVAGGLYFVLASVNTVVVFASPWNKSPYLWIVAALAVVQLAVTVVLGRIGANIACARMPG